MSSEKENTAKQVITLRYTRQLDSLFTIIRDRNTSPQDFIFYSERIIRLLLEEGLNLLPVHEKQIVTPTNARVTGSEFEGDICGVSIVRAGESMEKALREVCLHIKIGKILIQRNEETAQPILFYSKLPSDIHDRWVLLIDPMLATGGSACKAIEVLKAHGVKENRIVFINLIACPEGIERVITDFPAIRIVTGVVDDCLNEQAYILPGIGDFGDRYFGTC